MRLTIIVPDNTICKDGACIINVSWQGAPSNVRALQWYDNHGEIEFKNGLPNEAITELPDWANNAVTAWEAAKAYLDEQKQNSPEFSQKEKNKFTASGL